MSIELTGIDVRAPRRVRLVFNNLLAAAAFGAPAPSFYVVTPVNSFGSTPIVKAALLVPGSSTNVELVLSTDLSPGAAYTLSAIGVPAQDASVSTGASTQNFAYQTTFQVQNVEPHQDDGEILLYGIDLVWTNVDFLMTANGDLARLGGAANAMAAIGRRANSDGLPWDNTYGAKPRQYVDIPQPVIGNLRTALIAQAILDDRVKSVKVSFAPDPTDDSTVNFEETIQLIGNRAPESIPITIKTK